MIDQHIRPVDDEVSEILRGHSLPAGEAGGAAVRTAGNYRPRIHAAGRDRPENAGGNGIPPPPRMGPIPLVGPKESANAPAGYAATSWNSL